MYDNEFMEQLLQGISVQEERRHPGKTEKCLPGSKNEAELAEMEYCLREVETLACRMRQSFLKNPNGIGNLDTAISQVNKQYATRQYIYEMNLWDISVTQKDQMLKIQIPELLPHRKAKPECVFMYTLRQALYQYAVADPKRFSRLKEPWKEGAVLIVEHSYRSAEMVRDSDNVELKQAIDLLHFLGYIDSDRGTELNIFLTCNTTDQNKNETCLYLAPKACIQKFWD